MCLQLRQVLTKFTVGNARSFAFSAHVDVVKIEKHAQVARAFVISARAVVKLMHHRPPPPTRATNGRNSFKTSGLLASSFRILNSRKYTSCRFFKRQRDSIYISPARKEESHFGLSINPLCERRFLRLNNGLTLPHYHIWSVDMADA